MKQLHVQQLLSCIVCRLQSNLMDRSELAGLDANLLVALDALFTEEHVGRAARRVGLSESAMSHALARARIVFDDPLLVRVGRRMSMTARARRMAPALREGFARVASAVTAPTELELGTEERALRIAATDFSHSAIGVPLWHEIAAKAPRVDVRFSPMAHDSLAKLAEGELDLMISRIERARGFHVEVILEEPFVSMVRRGHPALSRRMTAARFAALDHVVVSPAGSAAGATDRELKKKKLKRRVAYVSPTFLAAARLVATSDLVLTGSQRNAREVVPWLDLATFTPGVRLDPFIQAMTWHERQEHDPFLAWVRDRIRAIAK